MEQPRPARPPRSAQGRDPGSTARRRGHLPRVEETSAGGLVVDRSSSVLLAALIARTDRSGRLLWSLPKGHLEDGETAQQAAVREVHEETGIVGVVRASLGVIDFWFAAGDRRVHKTVHHFLMDAVGGELSDADSEVAAVEWVPLAEVPSRLAHADERRLVTGASGLLAGPA